MLVVTSAQMKKIEMNSLLHNLTYSRLMENAGAAAAAFIRRTFRVDGLNCMIFCGNGNNGGDGFVVARKLYENGANVVIVLVDGPPSSDEARGMLSTAEMMELPVFQMATDAEKIRNCVIQSDIIIDAIYGTGFHGTLVGGALEATEMISGAIAAVISLDVPSGVECDTAKSCESAIRADFTVVFDSLKPVHVIPAAAGHCGKIELAEIGIPPEAHEGIESIFTETSIEHVMSVIPKRKTDSHKGTHGTLLIIAGSMAYRGAASLAVQGAMRSGAGICKIASVEAVCASVVSKYDEPVFLPLEQNEAGGIKAETAIPMLTEALESCSSVLIGCGMQNSADTTKITEHIIKNSKAPLIIDADGINAICGNINILQEANVPIILTPHPGEMARLCGCSAGDIQANRIGAAIQLAAERGVILVLKGYESLIALPDGKLYINRTGGPGLAKGGSGDILAGMIASLCAQGIRPEDAAAAAVYLHGLAGDRTAARLSEYGMLPSELLTDLCDIFLSMQR